MMHEYTLLDVEQPVEEQETDSNKVEYALCKLFVKKEVDKSGLEDSQQAGTSSTKIECTNYAYEDSILIIPESQMSILHLNESFPRTTSNNKYISSASSVWSGISGAENLSNLSQNYHDVALKEPEVEGDDNSLLKDNDTDLEAMLDTDEGTDLYDPHDFQKDQICSPDALKQHLVVFLLEDDPSLHNTDRDLGTCVSEHHNNRFQDSQHIEMELMVIASADGNDNSHLHSICQEMYDPTLDYGNEFMTHEFAASWSTDGDANAVSDGRYLSDMKIDEYGWSNYLRTSVNDTLMEDPCDYTAELWG